MNRFLYTSCTLISLLILIIGMGLTGCQIPSESPQQLSSQMDSVSYALGMDIARFYQKQDVPLHSALVYQGIKDVMDSDTTLFTDAEAYAVLGNFKAALARQGQINLAKLATENLAQSQLFFRTNREEEGVIALASGLQYKVIESGKGDSPQIEDRVKVSYSGKLLDGTVFDSSDKQGGSAEIGVSEAIPGWTEALLLMKPGDKWELYIPPHLAYGEEGYQGAIPPNSVLIYEVELSEILR